MSVAQLQHGLLTLFRILLQLRYQLRDAGWLDSRHAQMLGVSSLPWLLKEGLIVLVETEHAHGIEQPSFHELLNEMKTSTNGIPLPKWYPYG